MPKFLKSPAFSSFLLLLVISALVYLPFVLKFGYYKDDWYLMYAAGAKGPLVFNEIFSIDRPLRALVMIPTYTIFGNNPLYYNISAYIYRLLGALGFFWILSLLWPRERLTNLGAAALFLIYPGFLSQPNAIDYQSHLAGLAAGMISIALTIKALTVPRLVAKIALFLVSILLGLFYLGQIEWYIGLEVFRWGCIFFFFLQKEGGIWKALLNSVFKGWPALLISGGFLIWRLFFFESVRGATNLDLQFEGVWSHPMVFLQDWLGTLWNDSVDSFLYAWYIPFRRLSASLASYEWLPGLGIAALVFVLWILFQRGQMPGEGEPAPRSSWRRDAAWLGITLVIFGLLPVILVGRTVDFKSYSRYTLIASAGVVLLWQMGFSFIPNPLWRNIALGVLLFSGTLTHYVNGLVSANESEKMSRFWWEVSWRIPQMEVGTTLVARYPGITIEEDYFVWGPANLIYHPDSINADFPQPGIYAALLNEETIQKVSAGERQEFSNRRGIRTYPNYRNILILTQPTVDSCVHVIDGAQPELSSAEDPRLVRLSSFSETAHILMAEPFRKPPAIPFGGEPDHTWCYYYEKASFARQSGNWEEVTRLGEEAFNKGLTPKDQIEWMPVLEAYALSGNIMGLAQVEAQLTDPAVREQACQILQSKESLSAEVRAEISKTLCLK